MIDSGRQEPTQSRGPDVGARPIDTVAEIETPEHITFRVQVAGPSLRALAYGVDLLVRALIVVALGVLLSLAGFDVDVEEYSVGVLLVVMFVVEWGYSIFFESVWSGQTPGKRMMSLRAVGENGRPLSFVAVVLRNLLRGADWLPAGNVVGVLVMAVDGRFRRLGDLVAGTMVIVEQRSGIVGSLRVSPPLTADELAQFPSAVHLSPAEMDALENFLRRVGSLSPSREEELADLVVPMFAARFGLRPSSGVRFLSALFVRAGGQIEAPVRGRRGRARQSAPRDPWARRAG